MGAFLFSHALREHLKPRKLLVWTVLALALFGVSLVILRVSPDMEPGELYAQLSGVLVFRVLALAAAVFSMTVIGQEVEQKTIVYLLTRPIDRRTMLLSRALAAVAATVMVAFLCALAASAAVYKGDFLGNELLWRDLRAIAFGAPAYVALFVIVSLLLNKGAMLVCLLFAFGWETLVPNMGGNIYRLSISSYLTAIAERPSTPSATALLNALSGQTAVNTVSAATGMMVVGGIAVIGLFFAASWFRAFEYVPREDSD